MIEVDLETVRFGMAILYVAVFLGATAAAARIPAPLRRYAYPLLAAVGVVPLVIALQSVGVGRVPVAAGTVDLTSIARNVLAYVVIYGGVTRLGGASRRLSAVVVAAALVPILSAELAPAFGAGPLAAGVLVAVTLPYPLLLYLFLRPVWRAAGDVSPRRRLLHWKARNVLLFLYSMVLLFVFAVFGGLLTDPVLTTLLFEYSVFFFQAGIPAFLLYTAATMPPREAAALAEDLPGAGRGIVPG